MYLRRSTVTGILAALLLGGACTAAQESKSGGDEPSKFRKSENQPQEEMVEIKIRMPDGRVIVRRERKIASRIDPDHPIVTGERPPVVASKKMEAGDVRSAGRAVGGGSNGSSGSLSNSGGGGGGGGATRGRHSGGGGGGGGAQGSANADGANTNPGDGAPNNGDQAIERPSTTNPVQPDDDHKIRIYTWDMTGGPYDHLQLAVKVAPWHDRTPAELATIVARQVNASHHDTVALRFWKEFIPGDRHPFDISNPRELIASGGYRAGLSEYWLDFAAALRDKGVKPDYLIFDMEEGIRYWHLPEESRRGFFAQLMDPQQPWLEALPESMRSVTVDQFMDLQDPVGKQARRDYYIFAEEFVAEFMADVFSGAFEQAYGEHIPISNYRNIIPTFDTYGPHGEVYPPLSLAGISAPQTYVAERDRSRFPRIRNTTKSTRWNDLIDAINRNRSAAASGLVTPWISAPGFGVNDLSSWHWVNEESEVDAECWLWDELMGHLVAMGVDTFIAWNPGPHNSGSDYCNFAAQTDRHMDSWLAAHPRVPRPLSRNLPEIPLDSDEIVTHGFVTTYDDFVAVFGEE